MGKLGNVAYNIGTSLNKEDINTHRQGITPTTQTLQNLSTDEQLAYHTHNQALLDENKGQLEGEKESDGVWNQGVRPPLINTNNPNARRWNVNNNPHALTVRRETEAIRQTYPNFGGIQQIRNGPVTQREAAEYTAFRMFIRHGTNQTYADHNVAYREFLKSPYYQNLNRPNSTQLNIGLNNSNYNVARHEQINNRGRQESDLIQNAQYVSTANPNANPPQVATPRNLNEQIFWNQVSSNPLSGRRLQGLNNDPRFPASAGFQKMEATFTGANGRTITIHYQYNSRTGRAYDIKIVTRE
ncbi:Uncharacterised protein [Moraxella lacunata]|uniref:Uncharacterized protein n=1 Tax=Moraxella lacunata TaxID=477 RepID=A0A1V4GYN8_MORLA|nr:hypothetical protein [Moraxella lacunata]OPH37745.1 hypothetical protein B5J94_05140 [Moraxella lacunata]STZ74889.1 Uncharacterised protein [Moraxella lacunata]